MNNSSKISRRGLLAGIAVLPVASAVSGCAARATDTASARAMDAASGRRYYIANNGNDANDGLSYEGAIKSLDKLAGFFPGGIVSPNTVIVLEDGQYHRLSSPREANWLLSLKAAPTCTDLTRPKIITRNGGYAFFSGDFLIADSWSAASFEEVGAAGVSLGVEKRVMGAGFNHANFPCVDDFMLKPAVWHPPTAQTADGYPSSIHVWDAGEVGSDGVMHYADGAGVTQAAGQPIAYDGIHEIQHRVVGETRWVKIANPAIAAHYGSFSPVGAWVGLLTGSVQTVYGRIVNYDQANSFIEFTYGNGSGASPSTNLPVWNIRGCPFDLRKVGQYAWSADGQVLFAKFPANSTLAKRSIARQQKGVFLDGKWNTTKVGFARTACWIGQSYPALQINAADNALFEDVFIKQLIDPDRGNSIQDTPALASSTGLTFLRLKIEENNNKRGIALSRVYSSLIDSPDIAECGRTNIYFDGATGTASHGNTVRNANVPNNASVHGNGASVYPNAYNITFDRCAWLGQCGYVMTLQSGPLDRTNAYRNCISSNYRTPSTNPVGVYEIPVSNYYAYGYESNCTYDHLINIGNDIIFTSSGEEVAQGSNHNTTVSNVITNAILGNRSVSAAGIGSLSGVTFRDVLGYSDKYLASRNDWIRQGVTVDSRSKVDTSEVWKGTLSDQQWEYFTRNADGSYSAAQIGPDVFGPWIIPAYGSDIVLANFNTTFDRLWARHGLQKGRQFATVVNLPPKSTFTFPAGFTDNDLIFQDGVDRSRVMFRNNATAGVYQFTVRVVCSKATGPNSRDILINFTVRPDA